MLVVLQEQTAAWIRNFNPLTTATAARWPTTAGVYEPLFVFNSIQAEQIPWLATSHSWSEDKLTLTITTREGVQWSDGEAFSADDVAFTFRLIGDHAALDGRNVWSFLESVEATSPTSVDFRFQRVYIPGFGELAAQRIVPEHVWKDIEDPVTYPNENPVATGPFTEVVTFRNQIYELGRNPNYWRPGEPKIEALRFPAHTSNDRANLALVFDEADWAGKFIPAVDRVFVDKDPEHHRYWFPLTGSTIFLYANTMRPPFDDVRVRRALSLAIDRQLMVDVASHRYSRPSDATALSDAYPSWRSAEVMEEAAGWVTHDIDGANALLDAAGLARGEDGIRVTPDGTRCEWEMFCVSGWSDWVRACQVMARSLKDVGFAVTVKTWDFGAWFERVQKGDFDLTIGWSFEGPTPYVFYRCLMSEQSRRPLGEISGANWHRYASPAADAALRAFEQEADPARQLELAHELQRIFVDEAPAIPLYPNPSWAEYNTRRFTGFPSAENPYADPSPNKFDRGEILLVLTTLEPR